MEHCSGDSIKWRHGLSHGIEVQNGGSMEWKCRGMESWEWRCIKSRHGRLLGGSQGGRCGMASSHGMAVRQLSSEEEATACVKDG